MPVTKLLFSSLEYKSFFVLLNTKTSGNLKEIYPRSEFNLDKVKSLILDQSRLIAKV